MLIFLSRGSKICQNLEKHKTDIFVKRRTIDDGTLMTVLPVSILRYSKKKLFC